MTKITVYNADADTIEKVSDDNDITEAEVVAILCEYLEEAKKDNGWR